MPQRHTLAVFTNAVEGHQAEFAEWYDTVHITDMLTVPGVVSARRLEASPVGGRSTQPSPYTNMTLYEVETDDLPAVFAHLGKEAGSWESSPHQDRTSYAFWVFTDPTS